jgi:hypothetical protein
MELRILNSPKRIVIFMVVVVVLAYLIIKCVDSDMQAAGLDVIDSSINRQLNELVAQVPALKGIDIFGKERIHIVSHNDGSTSGYFEYKAHRDGSDCQLRVCWFTDSVSCRIMKIESMSTYSQPEVLWTKPNEVPPAWTTRAR